MRIVEIIPQLSSGGAERFVVDLCNALVKEHEVVLIVLHRLDKVGFFVSELDPKVKLVSMNKRKGMDFALFFRLFMKVRELRPDIVHTHLRGLVYSLLLYAFPTKVQFVHTVHNDAEKEAGTGFSLWIRRWAFKKRVLPVTISEESQGSFLSFYGIGATMIYNGRPSYQSRGMGMDDGSFIGFKARGSSVPILLNVARVEEQKNQIALAVAIAELNNEGHGVELGIMGHLGNGRIVDEIKNLPTSHVHLLGARSNPRDYMIAADAFCLSSLYEGMPITLIECFSVGAIPICTPVGGIKNMIEDGVNGLLAKGTSVTDLKNVILRFLEMGEEEKRRMKEHSKVSFARYDMKTCAANYERLMIQLCRTKNRQ